MKEQPLRPVHPVLVAACALAAAGVMFSCRPALAGDIPQARAAHTTVRLVAETLAVPASGPLWVGVHLSMDEGWHVYWRNPGDSGAAPVLAWTLPPGVVAGDIRWPAPHRLAIGPLVSYVYEGDVLLAVPLDIPVHWPPTAPLEVQLKASWLTCRVECVPGEADLSLTLPGGSAAVAALSPEAALFAEARTRWPAESPGAAVRATLREDNWVLDITPLPAHPGEVYFYPFRDDLVAHAAPQRLSLDGRTGHLVVPRSVLSRELPARIDGVLTFTDGDSVRAVDVRVPVADAPEPSRGTSSGGPGLSWWAACLFALLGGVVLNVMPCVLPVLSIKVLQLTRRASSRAQLLAHAGFYVLGIMVSFWALALMLALLKAAGQAVGWGFQFQSPVFVVAVAAALFVFALNLFGVFEFPAAFAGSVPGGQGALGAFASGVVMTLVATPCSAPFMGSALGFALGQSVPLGILIFTFLGLGLAAPFLLLALFPPLMKFVPAPGPWMITLKRVLGVLLLACVVWLVSVLWIQLRSAVPRSARAAVGEGIAWQSYSPEAVAAARTSGSAVFVDFTAAWCLTCQVNDLTVLRSPDVVAAFARHRVRAFKADWTRRDPEITAALAALGRSSVPVYIYYAPGQEHGKILSEVLTPAQVLGVLDN